MITEVLGILITILILLVSVGLFIFTYILNKRTPKPEGCQELSEACEGCQILSCAHHPKNNE